MAKKAKRVKNSKKPKKSIILKGDYLFTFLIAAVFILDRLIKTYVGDSCLWLLCIRRAVNDGAAFGILPGQTLFLVVVAIGVLFLIAMSYRESGWLGRLGLALITAGTISNMFDRVFYGHVLDVFSVFGSSSFNLADLSNLIGVLIFIVSLYGYAGRRKR